MSKPNNAAIALLAPWEVATGVAQAALPGVVPGRFTSRLSWAAALFFAVLLWPVYGLSGLLIGLVLGRLLALDLTTYTLPNIYTIPLMAISFFVALGNGQLGATLALWLALLLVAGVVRARPHIGLGIGEGDLKLLAAMAGFLGPPGTLAAIACGCLLWLPGAWLAPKQALPLGVPLVLGWGIILAFPGLPNALFTPITA